jgi:UDP-N-acetyl-D-mannosaminuronate dehydrogenase
LDFKKICVLGLGYIGLPANTFATNGVDVFGGRNPSVVETLQHGDIIHEPGLRTVVGRQVR